MQVRCLIHPSQFYAPISISFLPHVSIRISKGIKWWWFAWMRQFSSSVNTAVRLSFYQLPGYRVRCSPLDPRDGCHWFTNEKLGENRRCVALIGELVVNWLISPASSQWGLMYHPINTRDKNDKGFFWTFWLFSFFLYIKWYEHFYNTFWHQHTSSLNTIFEAIKSHLSVYIIFRHKAIIASFGHHKHS